METMNSRDFFNSLAERWDTIAVHPDARVKRVLDLAGIVAGDRILDVGSGTGVLVPHIIERVGPSGFLVALDVAEEMIEVSRRKHSYPNVQFVVGDYSLYESDLSFDLVIAYSCFPHFIDRQAFFSASRALLREGGRLVIAHIESRATINSLHDGLGGPPSIDLPPISETIAEAALAGFAALASLDDEDYYVAVLEAR